MKRWILFIGLLLSPALLAACGSDGAADNEDTDMDASLPDEQDENLVETELKDTEGTKVGTAILEEGDGGVTIHVEAANLPEGAHGFHIHEKAVCEQPDFESAGGHFNPADTNHGFDDPDGPHAGDLPNLEVGEDGSVYEDFTAEGVTLEKGEDNSLLDGDGTALVIHADADDNKSQPSGDSGDRIACGVIKE
jgi:Cu-Zn family superoxide dismutase